MSTNRRFAGIGRDDVGIVIAAVAALVGIAAVFTTAVDLGRLGGSQTRVLLAVVGIAIGVGSIRNWIDADYGGYEPPERERVRPASVPGEDFDELLDLAQDAGTTEATRFYRSQSEDRLLDIAVEVLRTHRDFDAETARERLRDGSWTDDEVAARCFRPGPSTEASDELSNAIREPVGGEHPRITRTRRALAELQRITEVSS